MRREKGESEERERREREREKGEREREERCIKEKIITWHPIFFSIMYKNGRKACLAPGDVTCW